MFEYFLPVPLRELFTRTLSALCRRLKCIFTLSPSFSTLFKVTGVALLATQQLVEIIVICWVQSQAYSIIQTRNKKSLEMMASYFAMIVYFLVSL